MNAYCNARGVSPQRVDPLEVTNERRAFLNSSKMNVVFYTYRVKRGILNSKNRDNGGGEGNLILTEHRREKGSAPS